MTVPAFHFEAKKHAYRQVQDGVVVSFVVHPNDLNAGFAVAPLGTRYMVALAMIGDDGEPISPEALDQAATDHAATGSTPAEPKQPVASGESKKEYTLANRVGMTCADKRFQDWLQERGYITASTDDAAQWVRMHCGVKSRAQIQPGTDAAARWTKLETQYLLETGQMAEQRR